MEDQHRVGQQAAPVEQVQSIPYANSNSNSNSNANQYASLLQHYRNLPTQPGDEHYNQHYQFYQHQRANLNNTTTQQLELQQAATKSPSLLSHQAALNSEFYNPIREPQSLNGTDNRSLFSPQNQHQQPIANQDQIGYHYYHSSNFLDVKREPQHRFHEQQPSSYSQSTAAAVEPYVYFQVANSPTAANFQQQHQQQQQLHHQRQQHQHAYLSQFEQQYHYQQQQQQQQQSSQQLQSNQFPDIQGRLVGAAENYNGDTRNFLAPISSVVCSSPNVATSSTSPSANIDTCFAPSSTTNDGWPQHSGIRSREVAAEWSKNTLNQENGDDQRASSRAACFVNGPNKQQGACTSQSDKGNENDNQKLEVGECWPFVGSISAVAGRDRIQGTVASEVIKRIDKKKQVSAARRKNTGAGRLVTGPNGIISRRKNATRETTAMLKDWLDEHGANPYPTKGEKIMLSIITKMSLTQVSTWFANARRRMKKENKNQSAWSSFNAHNLKPATSLSVLGADKMSSLIGRATIKVIEADDSKQLGRVQMDECKQIAMRQTDEKNINSLANAENTNEVERSKATKVASPSFSSIIEPFNDQTTAPDQLTSTSITKPTKTSCDVVETVNFGQKSDDDELCDWKDVC